MMQASLLNYGIDERNLFLFVWGVLQINFLPQVLEISAAGFKMLLESSLPSSNLFLLLFTSVLFVNDLQQQQW